MPSHVSLSPSGHPKARQTCLVLLPGATAQCPFYVHHLRANTAQPRTEVQTQGRATTPQHQMSPEGWLSTALASFSVASILRRLGTIGCWGTACITQRIPRVLF